MSPRSVQARALAFAFLLLAAGVARAQQLILDDTLQGSTTGLRSGGSFVAGGWRVDGQYDSIYWHLPTVEHGAAEWELRGLEPGECRSELIDSTELFHMYDHTYAGSDTNYNPGYRDNPYKHFVRKQGCIDIAPDRAKIVWKIGEEFEEVGTQPLSWDSARTYRFREEWGPDGDGRSTVRLFRDGVLRGSASAPGIYAPAGHSIRIGASTRRDPASGAPLGAVYANLKVWDLSAGGVPAPQVTSPAAGARSRSPLVFVEWTGSGVRFQARANVADDPEAEAAWDSGEVVSGQRFTFTGALPDRERYYVFVRAGTTAEWSPWSAPGRWFAVDSSFMPPGPDRVVLRGNSLTDHRGPFLALGATYFSALRLARTDRARLASDLTFLGSRGFEYVRVLSMVGWNSSWRGIEIAPVSFTGQDVAFVPAWPDYWQQFRDLIDIVHQHGLRAQVTVFADAQLMPSKPARIAHMETLLQNLAGREHKVVLLEVANEAWQNGFPGAQGIADLREFGAFLAQRTEVPVALSAPLGGTNAALTELYAGSAADIATEHFTRDTSTSEGGWLPVRDCWRVELASGVPPVSSNEPIGPGSSVSRETDPIKLVMSAAFAWGANLPMYVFHSSAGVRSLERFEDMAGIGDFVRLADILPPDLSSWVRNDGLEPSAPFTIFADGQANRYWPDAPGATRGVVRNTGKTKGAEFVTLPIGVLAAGVEMEARRGVSFVVYDPLTGSVVAEMNRTTGERFTLGRGPGAYILKGVFTDAGAPLTEVSVDLGAADVERGLRRVQNADGDTTAVVAAGRDSRRNLDPAEDLYFYFGVSDAYAYQGDKPALSIRVEFLDAGTGFLELQYDSSTGTGLGAHYHSAGRVQLAGTGAWRVHTYSVDDAYFGNRQNAGADFRVAHSGGVFHLDVVTVSEQPRAPGASVFPFDAGAEGWALEVWMSGPYDPGTLTWEASGGNPDGRVRCRGSGQSNNQDTCTREGGILTRLVSTQGLAEVRVEYDVVASLAAPPGPSGAGNCPVLGATSEDKLVVFYSVSGTAGPWVTAQVLTEPGGLPSSWTRRSVDLSRVTAAADNPAFALRFQWQFNAAEDEGSIDNVAVRGVALETAIPFRRGDANADGSSDLSDAVYTLNHLFGGGSELLCPKSGDSNDDGAVDISDPVHLLDYLFLGGPRPREPWAACGEDPSDDALPCESHPPCEE
jgi:hypothetical protein